MSIRTSDDTLLYNGIDAHVTQECLTAFQDELSGPPDFMPTYDLTIALLEPLMYFMTRGIRVDHERLDATKVEIDKQLDETLAEIHRLCKRELNPLAPKDVQAYFYIEKNIPPYYKKNTKGETVVTVDDNALQRISRGTSARKGYHEATLMQKYRGLRKLKGTYLDISFDADSRMRCSCNPRGTKFGRISTSQTVFGTGMNMQNLPESFKGFLVPDDGYFFIELDKRSAEWVVVANVCGDLNMLNAIASGADPHAYTASQMFRQPIELILEEDRLLGHESNPAIIAELRNTHPALRAILKSGAWIPRNMSMRQCGKKSNHGLNYDETYKMFALINAIQEAEAKRIVEFYHTGYPGIKRDYKATQQELQTQNRILYNLFGRPCRFLERWGPDLFKAAYSYKPQSTVAELINRGIVDIYHSTNPVFDRWEILTQTHDSILFQAPMGNSQAAGVLFARDILNVPLKTTTREFVIETDMKVGFSWGNLKEVPIHNDEQTLNRAIQETLDGLKTA